MKAPRHPAFTLIELLVVIGLVALLAGALGLALREANPSLALQSAQASVASLLAAARGQAALQQNRTMLVVDADPAAGSFLRGLHLAVESAPHSGRWRITGPGAVLPPGIYVVPEKATFDGVMFTSVGNPGVPWPAQRCSSLGLAPPGRIAPSADNPAGKYLGMSALLAEPGPAGPGAGDKLVLSAARRTATGVNFDRPELLRGVVLSSYGVAIFINDAPGFDF
jgi:prepilin-type N-terminal cleavage/methylation domain-containing protein